MGPRCSYAETQICHRSYIIAATRIWQQCMVSDIQKRSHTIGKCSKKSHQTDKNIQHKTYTQRLKYLGLPSLQYRRLRADMIETYKILNNIDKVQYEQILPLNQTTTRGHSKKLYKKNCRTNVRKYSFSQRVVDEWNKIPKKVIDSQTINTFKSQLNNHWKNLDIKFSPDIYQPGDENKLLRRVQAQGLVTIQVNILSMYKHIIIH